MNAVNNIRIFIADNNESEINLLKDKLLEHNDNYKIVTFLLPEKLIKYFEEQNVQKNKYNYIILDFYLHSETNDSLDGQQIIDMFEKKWPFVNIILFSLVEDDDMEVFEAQLSKPNVIECIKRTDFSYTYLQNIIAFDFAKKRLHKKKLRMKWAAIILVGVIIATILF